MKMNMKLNKLLLGSLLVALVFSAGTGCKKASFDINKNPNQPTDSTVTYNLVLPAAMHATADWVATDWGWLQNWLGYWARSGTYAPNVQEETYAITTNFGTFVWNDIYDNLYDYQVVQTKAEQADAKIYQAIARIMKAHNFQILVDIYNNVPYSQALKGAANITPKYDKGVDVYKDLLRQLDTAINLLNATASLTTAQALSKNVDILTQDLVYGKGNPTYAALADDAALANQRTLWKKFANTIKLRILVHAADVPAIDKAAEMAIINAEGSGFLGAGQTAQINPGFNSTKPNPYYRTYEKDEGGNTTGSNIYYRANSFAVGDGNTDPGYYGYNGDLRENRFYSAPGGAHVGVAYGLPPVTANAASNLSSVAGPGVSGSGRQAWILTDFESLFLQAEARHRGIITTGATAQALMQSAIRQSFVYLGLTVTNANSYMAGNAGYPDVDYTAGAVVPGGEAGGLFTIISQKWFALNAFAPYEVWTDYRRVNIGGTDHFIYGESVGYNPGPPISVAPQNTATKIPSRLLYPQNEYNYNGANVGAEGTIDRYGKIFWDN
jgi:hypothetical protein